MDTETQIVQKTGELEAMWNKIQDLKKTDLLAAQVMYHKYQKQLSELPPEIPENATEDK